MQIIIFFLVNTGYIQTPGWSDGIFYPPNMNSTVRVEVPEDHSVMVSFVDLFLNFPIADDCLKTHDWVQISYTASGSTHAMAKSCGRSRPSAFLADAQVLLVHFVSDSEEKKLGFKLHFSFHNSLAMPEQFPDGTWNCSVPHWLHFRHHLPCDLEANCRGGEDEADCPYTSDLCGPGLISFGGGCYQYVIRDGQLSWHQASMECQRRGGRLASLHNADQWTTVMGLLALRDFDHSRKGVYVGIRTVNPARPSL